MPSNSIASYLVENYRLLTHIRSDHFKRQSISAVLLTSQISRVILKCHKQNIGSVAVNAFNCSPMSDVLHLKQYARSADQIQSKFISINLIRNRRKKICDIKKKRKRKFLKMWCDLPGWNLYRVDASDWILLCVYRVSRSWQAAVVQ